MSKRKIDSIFLKRTSRTMHPDLTCDECAQQFRVGVHADKTTHWKYYTLGFVEMNGPYSDTQPLCPELIKTIVEHHSRIVCPKCTDGVLCITEESRFDIDLLLAYLK